MGALRYSRRILAAKVEGTEGTAEALTAAEGGILALNPQFSPAFDIAERNAAIATLSRPQYVVAGRPARLTFEAEVKGAGSAYSASNITALGVYLRACGFGTTVVTTGGSESVTYAPTSSEVTSITIGMYVDGLLHLLAGARGNAKLIMEAGKPARIAFDFLGVYAGTTDMAIIAPTLEATQPPIWAGATATIHSYAAVVSAVECDMGNTLSLRPSAIAASGYLSAQITARNPKGKVTMEMVTVATKDWLGLTLAGTVGAIASGTIGATQYNRYTVASPKVVLLNSAFEDRDGVYTLGADVQFAKNAGDDEISIAFN